MQRVVRSTLAGILAAAALVGCGDKVTVPPVTTTPPDAAIHSVTVSPSSATIAVGAKFQFAAAVDAGPAAPNRTVTWSSSNTAVATVGTDGTVTGVSAGTASIIAKSADPNVSGAAALTVTAATSGAPTVTIAAINQTVCGIGGCNSVPATLTNAAGQLDVVLNVDSNGQQLKSVSGTFTCPGSTTMTQTQTISAASADVAAEAAAAPITLSFNTALFNATTGVPQLRNGQCSFTASATTAGGTQNATLNGGLVLNNLDGVVITESFAPYTNAEGKTTITSASDANGLPWKGGAVTVSALPVLYSGRALTGGGTVTINLPGATNAIQTVTVAAAGAVTTTYSATATSGSGGRVTGQTLFGACCEVNTTTPFGVTPTVSAIDAAGNDVPLAVLNTTQPLLNLPNPTFRLDNAAPQPPVFFGTPGRQAGWVNASYAFTGVGVNGGFSAATGSANYISCGDGSDFANPSGAAYACAGQQGVSAGGVGGNGGTNGLTTFSFYALSSGAYSAINANGTSTSATTCATTGWTSIPNAGALAEADATGNPFFIVRVFETDKLGNARCVDMAVNANASPNINTGAFAAGRFSVDKTAPTTTYLEPSVDPTAAANNGALNVAGNLANFNIKIAGTDNASGFSATPIITMVTRLAINPATGVASNAAGNFNNTFACPTGLSQNVCVTTALGFSNPATDGVVTLDGTAAAPGCAGCGYYTWSQTPLDRARNAATTVTGTATPTIAGAFAAGAPGYRQVVVDQQAPVAGGIAVPASITGGSSASFATNATDNLDLINTDYTLTYAANPVGNVAPGVNLPIRATGPAIGVAFDNVLTTTSSFNLAVPFFIRSVATTTAANAPQNNGGAGLPTSIAMRAYDAAGNPSVVTPATNTGFSAIGAANVPQTNHTDYTVAPPGANAGATMISFNVSNAAANISNCPAAGCAGNAAPANPTSVSLTAVATGNEGANFQFLNPFSQVQFYYFDTVTGEYILIGSAVAPLVSDNATVTVRTFTWTLSPAFDPPASLGSGVTLKVIALGVNALGDGLATQVNAAISLTNP